MAEPSKLHIKIYVVSKTKRKFFVAILFYAFVEKHK